MSGVPHKLMPVARHDEEAEQLFVRDFKAYLTATLEPQGRRLADAVDPGEGSNDRVRQTYERLFDYEGARTWASLRRTSQEMLWRAANRNVQRELPRLNAEAAATPSLGSLTIDPDFVLPAYMAQGDIHLAPGGYHHEGDGMEQGALLDRGSFIYMMGTIGGLMGDGRGHVAIQHVFDRFEAFEPQRILDMGCGMGNSSIPAAMAYPQAEVHALDVGVGMLRYAHARASALGHAIHFKQGSAEQAPYADQSFDLVYSCTMLHETSPAAIGAIMAECFRLLRPGGIVVHMEVPNRYESMDMWSKIRAEIEHDFNNEPNWRGAISADYETALAQQGFEDIASGFQVSTDEARRGEVGFSDQSLGSFKSWFVVSARRPAMQSV